MSEDKKKEYVVDESLGDDFRYTEELGENNVGPYRECALWIPKEEKPVSGLKFYPFEQRFGSVAVACEGIGDVATEEKFRKRGYITRVMTRALAGAAERVDASFLFGIGGLYGNFGFSSCMTDSDIDLWTKRAEDLIVPESLVRGTIEKEDLPDVIRLFNETHRFRPWTRVRTEVFEKRLEGGTWRPGPRTITIKEKGVLRGYALVRGYGYGWGKEPYKVVEAVADSPGTARALTSAFCSDAAARGLDTITVEEPYDSTIGRCLCHLGGKVSRGHSVDGGGMGLILNRSALITALEPELERRAGAVSVPGGAIDALGSGELVPDSKVLIKLLTGYWSWADAEFEDIAAPEGHEEILNAWFPGGGTRLLPVPYAHSCDGY